MKKMLLVALNAKYSHTSLSVRSIKSYVKSKGDFDISYIELTINDEYFSILRKIEEQNADIIGFSCYIWNVELIKKLLPDVKSVCENAEVFLGGPEVSYNYNVFSEFPDIDYVIRGEGEDPVLSILKGDYNREGICFKDRENGFGKLIDMENIPFVYEEGELETLKERAVYYETSRGCPFKCAFCISSLTKGVRVLPLERVFKEIDIFIEKGIRRVKLVDRTFNFDKERSKKIIRYILKRSKNTCFHFEIGADLLDDELIDLMLSAKRDVIQLEAGIQSANGETLALCDRKTNMDKLFYNLKRLSEGEIRVHVDLIAGLPKEDYTSFKNSFNVAYNLNPTVLQVGFLKLLHGSKLKREAKIHGYKMKKTAPYEVLSSNDISFKELMLLKLVDRSVDEYLNSELFKNSLRKITDKVKSPFEFFLTLGKMMPERPLSLKDKFEVLINTVKKVLPEDIYIKEEIKLDYMKKQRGSLPGFFDNYKTIDIIKAWKKFIREEENIEKYIPSLKNVKIAEIPKLLDFEVFKEKEGLKIIAFDRKNNLDIDIPLKIIYDI